MIPIIKSLNDNREYKLIQLENKLRCLIISDPDADQSAAALDVHVGQSLDPKPLYGTAHFLEHLLFMGSKKFPSENEYLKIISDYGGYSNAYTSITSTNYQFQVQNEGFSQVLDMFAQFFICPLLDESSVDREMQAVDSEFQQCLQHDGWHSQNLYYQLSHEDSYLNRFTIGNLETLKQEGIRDALLDFHKKYYSANIMTLCVLDCQPIEKLEQLVNQLFSQIINFDVKVPDMSLPVIFDERNTNQLIKFVPVQNKDVMQLVWQLPYVEKEFHTQPLQTLVDLFGHEGKNSLLSYLIDEDLAQSVTTSQEHELNCISLFQIDIELTKNGFQNWYKVIQAVQQYANMLSQKGPQEYFFNEIVSLGKIKFRYAEKSNPFNYVTNLSSHMQLFENFQDLQYLIQYSYFPTIFEPKIIQQMIDSIKDFKNFNIFLRSQEFEAKLEKKEKYFGTQYQTENISQLISNLKKELIENPKLNLPPKNIYIPENLEVLPLNEQLSKAPILTKLDNIELWYQKDDKFLNPKSFYQIKYLTNENSFNRTLRSQVFQKIWGQIQDEYLREEHYIAGLASLNYQLQILADGIIFKFIGYSDTLPNLIIQTFNIIKNLQLNQNLKQKFDQAIEKQLKNFQNQQLEQTYKQASLYVNILLQEFQFENQTLANYLQTYKFENFLQDINNWLVCGDMIIYSYGNVTIQQSINLSTKIKEILKLEKICRTQLNPVRIVNLDQHFSYEKDLIDIKNENSCSIVLFQLGFNNIRENLLLQFVMQFLDEPCFNQLRTIEQLGYVVFSQQQQIREIMLAQILVQSQKFSSEYLVNRIDLFLQDIKNKIQNLTDEEFDSIIQPVQQQIKKKDINMNEHFNRIWSEINRHSYVFDRKEQYLQMIENIKKQEFQQFFENKFFIDSKRIDIQFNANSHKQELNELKERCQQIKCRIQDSLQKWKLNQSLWPDKIMASLLSE